MKRRAPFAALVEPILGPGKAAAIGANCRRIAALADVRELIALCSL